MGFRAPDTPNLLPLLLQHTLNQRSQAEARREQEESIARRRADAAFDQAVQLTPQVGWKAAIAGVGPDFPTDRLDFVKGLDKALKERQAQQTQVSTAQQSAPDIAAMLANPNLEAQGGQALQQAIVALQSRPELIPILMQQVGQTRDFTVENQRQSQAQAAAAQQQVLAKERRGEGYKIAGENRAVGRVKETRGYTEDLDLEKDVRSMIAEAQAAGTPIELSSIAQEISDRYKKPLSFAEQLVDRASLVAQGDVLEIKRSSRGVQGKKESEERIDRNYRLLQEEFGDDVLSKQSPELLRDHIAAVTVGDEVYDRLAQSLLTEEGQPGPVFHRVSNKAEAAAFLKRREMQAVSLKTIEDLFGVTQLVRDDIESGRLNPNLVAAEGYTGIGKKLGINNPLVGVFENIAYSMAVAIAAETQGGGKGVSDLDMRATLALPPTLQEIALNPALAEAKLQQLRAQTRDKIMSDSDPKLRKQLESISRVAPSSLERKIIARSRAIIAKFTSLNESGDVEGAQAAANELMDEAAKIPRSTNEASPELQKYFKQNPGLER